MNFIQHSELRDKHAFLGGSNYEWINYTPEHLIDRWHSMEAKELGTLKHAYAAMAITLGQKQADKKLTLGRYINDGIGFRMTPEVTLKVSDVAFGTADTISYRKETVPERGQINVLRIHDLKTGVVPADMRQPMIYAAFFCIEYRVNPFDIYIELRIYQNNDVLVYIPDPQEIKDIIDTTLKFSPMILQERLKG